MTPHEMSQALITIAEFGIVNYKRDTKTLLDAAEMIERLAERVAIMSEVDGNGDDDAR